MKKIFFIILIFLNFVIIYGQTDWKAYTNTSHIFSIDKKDNKILLSTWGGLQYFNTITKEYENTYTGMDLLSENFVKDSKFSKDANILYVATKANGIDRFKNLKPIMPINDVLGLISNNVNKMIIKDSLLFIATKFGLSVFLDKTSLSFPILIKNFTVSNGLSSNNITSLALYQNKLFCGSGSGLDFIDIDSLKVSPAPWHNLKAENSPLLSNSINDLSATENFMSVATKSGLTCFKNPYLFLTWQNFEQNNSIFPIYAIDDTIFYSYGYWDEDQLTIIKENNTIFSILTNPFNQPQIQNYNDIDVSNMIMGFKKYDDGYYIYTWGEGLYYSENLIDWISYMPNCPASNNVFRIALDKSEKLWISSGHHGAYPTPTGTKGVSSFDGITWQNYSISNSPLISNNIDAIAVDNNNSVWFGTRYAPSDNTFGWQNGISVCKQKSCLWESLDVFGNFIIDLYFDKNTNYMWATCYDRGVAILDENFKEVQRFTIYGSSDQKVLKTFPAMGKIFFGFWWDGIKYWDDSTVPDYNVPEKWIQPKANELITGKLYDMAYRESKYGEKQVWFATANGLFMFNGENWYWYGPIQKKRILASSFNWEPDNLDQPEYHTPEYWYVVGQERLYGSATTYPTALLTDPFGSIWIGTKNSGITRFYPDDDLYINYNVDNSPLLSNVINDFLYDPQSGILYIGTNQGLNSVYIGITNENNKVKTLKKTIAYPNPFSPYKGDILRIENKTNMPKGNTYCKIYDLNGNQIIKLKKNDYQQFEWNGKNPSGKICAPGIYFYVVFTSDGQIDKNKFVILR